MIDTHTHLYSEEFEDGGVGAVERAIHAGVDLMVFPAVDALSIQPMKGLHDRFPENIILGIGLHPTELGDDPDHTLDEMEKELISNPGLYKAIGETGIDLYWDASNKEAQKKAFARQYEWALKYNLPLIIHCREGVDTVLEVISSFEGRQPEMIFHSFTSDAEDVRKIREVCNPWFGINGVATFKNAQAVRDAVKEIGIDRIVLETDSPYLAPVPHRGKRNETSYIGSIRDKIGEVLGISSEEVERITDSNAKKVFNL